MQSVATSINEVYTGTTMPDMIEAIKKGDELAFGQVFRLFRSRLYGYFLKKGCSEEDARDLVQSTFLKLWQQRSSLNHNYLIDQQLFFISRCVFIDYIRRQQKVSRIKSLLREEPLTYISEEFDTKKQVYATLKQMPSLRKTVFELHRFQGYSYAEIADRLSISVKSVDNHVTKAVRQLKKAVTISWIFLFPFFL